MPQIWKDDGECVTLQPSEKQTINSITKSCNEQDKRESPVG